jgi:signal transduction histidine kinase
VARRIVLSVLLLIAAVVGVVAVPLGVVTAGQERRTFEDETVASATTLAGVAEERLDDGVVSPALGQAITALRRDGYRVSVLDAAGRRVAGTADAPVAGAAASGGHGGTVVFYPSRDRIGVIAPVRSDDGRGIVGSVIVTRPTTQVDQRVGLLWTLIAVVAAAGLVAAALVAMALARWVSRPLRSLERAAQSLGDGDLSARSPAGRGPEEVRSLAANFNQMADRLQALVHGHRATTADVSHQLRTPLAALRLRLDVLAQDADDEMAAELAGAQEEIARLSRLVNGLLAVARAENVTAAPVYLAVDAVISNRVAAWRPAAEEREVRLISDVQPVGARMGDGQLEQVLDNLIANAIDALPPGGTIWIGATAMADRARITVADDGPGMPPAQRKHAFRRFATGTDGGTGLGLAIVDRLVLAAGGSAALSDTPGGGLTVTIDLPLARRDRDHDGEHRLRRGPVAGFGRVSGPGERGLPARL